MTRSATYDVRCNLDGCPLGRRRCSNLDEVLDLQAEHVGRMGDHHILEFERIQGPVAVADD